MHVEDLLSLLRSDATALRTAAEAAPDAPVPSCPGWDRRRVVQHLCVPYGWVLAQLEAGPDEQRGFRDAERPPADGDLFAFFAQQADRLVERLDAIDPDAVWPTWAGPRPASWFSRRMAHETAIHRFDVAGGPIEPAAAVDGIDELLEELSPFMGAGDTGPAGSVHLHATDDGVDGGEWLVTIGPDGITHRKEHAKGDVAVRGSASDLFLWAWNRLDLDGRFEVFGDEALARRWREALSI